MIGAIATLPSRICEMFSESRNFTRWMNISETVVTRKASIGARLGRRRVKTIFENPSKRINATSGNARTVQMLASGLMV